MSVLDVVFITTTGVSLGFLLVGVYILRAIHVSIESRLGRVDSFISPRGDQPSGMAEAFDLLVERAFNKVAGSKMGVSSGMARSEKSSQIEYIKAVVADQQPMIAMALDQVFPKWGKMFADNPKMVDQAMAYLKSKSGEKAPEENGAVAQPTLFPIGGD